MSWIRTCPANRVAIAVRLLLTLFLSTTFTECLLLVPHQFASQQAHFAVDVPGIMTSSKKTFDVKGFGAVNTLEFGSKWSNVYYSVWYSRLPAAAKLDTHVLSTNEILSLTMTYARAEKGPGSTIISSKGIRFRDLLGVEVIGQEDVQRGASPKTVVVTSWIRYFLVGDGAYAISASVATKDTTPSKATEDFLNSFRVLGVAQ